MSEKKSKIQKYGITRSSIIMRVSLSGVFAALIFVATRFIMLPTGYGYYNLGDGIILICAFLMGPIAFFPASIGSAFADLASGYPMYIPATFLIKGLMGAFAGYWFKRFSVSVPHRLIAFVGAEIIMITGYFIYEALPIMYGPVVAGGHIVFNSIQAGVGIAVAMILSILLRRLRPRVMGALNKE